MTTTATAASTATRTAAEVRDSSRVHTILTAYLQSKAVFTALELGAFEALEKQGSTIGELADELGLEHRPTRALLVALTGLDLVRRDGDSYRNTEEASRFLVQGAPEYMGGFAEHQNKHFGHFDALDEAVRSNASLNQRVLKDGYRDQGAAAGEGREGTGRLIQAMRVSSRLQAGRLAQSAPLAGVDHVVDLGCGSGDYSIALAQHHPDLAVTSLDYPAVCELVRVNVQEAGVAEQVTVQPADIMQDPWPSTSTVLLSHVLDGYGPERAAALIQRVYDHLPEGGRLLVHAHMPSLATGLFPYMFGLILLVNTEEGEVRDSEDIVGWVRQAGFREVETSNVSLLSGLVVATK
ncbi:methyltransferase domain-containing protein [Streptomyces triticagri]|uniref:Methyltransferase domain-containing protein n=1 Tax=Streptomyces triticagri TaxID=2293568 RepID=A0A372M189_9ACTN|nr:methyltransferase [Streptomyces triticagri]RFU84714.1 methyltransferase domain-containing protein [Streptomyces triticagri]